MVQDDDERGEQRNRMPPRASALRSVLARGGNSPSAAALAFKDRLGRRIPKFSKQDSKEAGRGSGSGGRGLRAATRGRGLGRDKPGLRPPVQHSDSISSDDGGGESPRGRGATVSDDEASSNSRDMSPAPGDDRETDDGDDFSEEAGGYPDDLRLRHYAGRGIGSGGGGAGSSALTVDDTKHNRSQLSGHLRRLSSTARSLRWPNSNATSSETTANNRKKAASAGNRPGAIITTAATTTANSPAGIGAEASPGGDESAPIHASNNDYKKGQRRQSIFRSLATRRQNEEQRGPGKTREGGAAPTRPGGLSPTASSHRGTPRLEHRRMPLWRRIGGWDKLDDAAGDYEGAVVSGAGRPAVGAVENVLYGWFGGLVARPWPGAGLALLPDSDVKVSEALGVWGCRRSLGVRVLHLSHLYRERKVGHIFYVHDTNVYSVFSCLLPDTCGTIRRSLHRVI